MDMFEEENQETGVTNEELNEVTDAVEVEDIEEVQDAAPVEVAKPEPVTSHHVPLSVLLDERDKLKDAKRRLAEYEAREAQARSQQYVPDARYDPQGFMAHQQQMLQEQMYQKSLELDYKLALSSNGPDLVEAARTWAYEKGSQDPTFDYAFGQQRDPINWIIAEYKKEQLLNDVQSDPDAYVRRRAQELGLLTPQEPKKLPSGSLAAAPSAGKPTEPSSNSAFDDMFKR